MAQLLLLIGVEKLRRGRMTRALPGGLSVPAGQLWGDQTVVGAVGAIPCNLARSLGSTLSSMCLNS